MSHQLPLPRSAVELHLEVLRRMELYEPLEQICKAHHVWLETVLSPAKTKRVMQARLACYLHLRSLEMSYQEVGRVMLRNHSSVVHAVHRELRRLKKLEAPTDGATEPATKAI